MLPLTIPVDDGACIHTPNCDELVIVLPLTVAPGWLTRTPTVRLAIVLLVMVAGPVGSEPARRC